MKKVLLFSLLFTLITSCSSPTGKVGAGINLGKQVAAVVLTTGNNNNVTTGTGAITGFLRVTANASGSTMTGIDSTGAADGDVVYLRNDAAAGVLTLTNADAGSLTANQFQIPGATSAVVNPGKAVMVEWDLTAGKWMLVMGGGAGNDTITGHQKSGGATPVLTTCGTAPAITGSDYAGKITTGSAATTCTLTFATTYGTAPACLVATEGGATQPTYTTSATAITVSVDIASTVYNYICVGR